MPSSEVETKLVDTADRIYGFLNLVRNIRFNFPAETLPDW
jgi:hypothetical protein